MDRNAFAPVDTAQEVASQAESDQARSNPYTVSQTTSVPESNFVPTPDDLIMPTGHDELIVINDFKRIPTLDLFAMTRNPIEFALVFCVFKVLRLRNPPFFAAALKSPAEIAYEQIPESLRADFDVTADSLRGLGMTDPRYMTAPTIGSRLSIELIMTTPDGRIQASFVRMQQRNGKFFEDQSYRGLGSRIGGNEEGGTILVTREKKPQPRSGAIHIVQLIRSDSFEVLMEHHERRLAEESACPITVGSQVQRSIDDERRVTEELIRRRILRPATAKEVFSIEAASG